MLIATLASMRRVVTTRHKCVTFPRGSAAGETIMGAANSAPLVERVAVSDVYVTGVGRISIAGACARIIMTVRDEAEAGEQEVAARLILPLEAIPEVIAELTACLRRACESASLVRPVN